MELAATSVAIENEHLRIEIDPETGAVLQVANLACDLQLVAGRPAPPWRIRLLDGSSLGQAADFRLERRSNGIELYWSTERGDDVQATITLAAGEQNASFTVAVQPGAGPSVDAIEYPVLGGSGQLT